MTRRHGYVSTPATAAVTVGASGGTRNERSGRRTVRRGAAGLAAVGLGAVLLAACGSAPSAQPNVPKMTGHAPWMVVQKKNTGSTGSGSVVNLQINDVNTPDGSQPAYVGPSGVGAQVLFTAKAGTTVKVVVANHDPMPHTFTAADLGVNATINPESTTTFTVTPTAAGTFSWYCSVPCGDWVMSHPGYMKGSVTVTA